MHERQHPDRLYAYPAHRSWWRRLLWRLGFDPLTVRERLAQVRCEAADWKRWGAERAEATYRAWGDGRSRSEWYEAVETELVEHRGEIEAALLAAQGARVGASSGPLEGYSSGQPS